MVARRPSRIPDSATSATPEHIPATGAPRAWASRTNGINSACVRSALSRSRPIEGTNTISVFRISSRASSGRIVKGPSGRTGRRPGVAVRTRNRGASGFPWSVFHSLPASRKTSSGPRAVEAWPPLASRTVTSIMAVCQNSPRSMSKGPTWGRARERSNHTLTSSADGLELSPFTPADLERLRFIRTAQATGFPLDDVTKLLPPAYMAGVLESRRTQRL